MDYAAKFISARAKQKLTARREINLLSKLDHERILFFQDAFEKKNTVILITELYPYLAIKTQGTPPAVTLLVKSEISWYTYTDTVYNKQLARMVLCVWGPKKNSLNSSLKMPRGASWQIYKEIYSYGVWCKSRVSRLHCKSNNKHTFHWISLYWSNVCTLILACLCYGTTRYAHV